MGSRRWKATGRRGILAAVVVMALLAGAAIEAGARQIVRGDRADRVTGTAMADVILVRGGNDLVRAGRGVDVVRAGPGRDRVFAGPGNDRAYGDSGNDRVYGESGRDRAYGSAGADRVSGGAGNDSVYGQSGRDGLFGDAGADRLSGGADRDFLNGGRGTDRVYAGAGNDVVEGRDRARDARIDGGAGRDVCTVDNADVAIVTGCEVIQAGSPPPPPSGGGGTGVAPGGGGGTGGTGGGGGTTRPAAFTLTSARNTTCQPGSVCNLQLAGFGAKGGSVTVESEEPNVVGQFAAEVQSNGTWSVKGDYGCFEDGTVTLRSGSEQIIVAIDCETPSPPSGPPSSGPGNGPLTVTSASGTTCPSGPDPCPPFTITGTGADGGVVATVGPPAVSPAMADQADDAGNWSISPQGGWGCSGDGEATVTIRDSTGDEETVKLTCT